MKQMNQEWIALGIVGITFLYLVRGFFKSYLAAPVAGFLLKRQWVRLAMKIKSQEKPSSQCGGCDCKKS